MQQRTHLLPRLVRRLPVWLYRLGLGGLLGRRFVRLTHSGPEAGQRQDTVIEVLRHDMDTGAVMIPAAWGERAEWVRNVRARPEATVMVGRDQWAVRAEALPVEEAAQEWYVFATDYPTAFARLTRLVLGAAGEATVPGCRKVAEQMAVVALVPALYRSTRVPGG
jgi:deazaflavin-dependent oxidoreductase (nitroreductase family)